MTELRPYPLGALITRMFRELEREQAIFDLSVRRFFLGGATPDLSVDFHRRVASTPLGPAAGPQSQMAQNILLSWLGGCRIMELKTVQVDDELKIPRPCIDMQTVGYNVEWSQELRLEQSLEEYVKGSMLIQILAASGRLPVDPGLDRTLFDMSVGYDLEGIRSDRVQAFTDGMLDCSRIVDRLRAEIPGEFGRYRELDFDTRLSDTLTLSTFHGCPPDEIEGIIDFLLREKGLHCIVKLNPMLLGAERTRELLHGTLGFEEVHVPDSAFERDTTWEQMLGFVERLAATAHELDLSFGVKFTNTLIVENRRDFFPESEREMYLSGRPLHVLAMQLVQRFRRHFGDRFPISFSAGIDRKNFPDAVALGLVPVTVCSDLLKPGGYGRARGYFDELLLRMDEVGAGCIGDYVIRAYGLGGDALDRLALAPGDPRRLACERALAGGSDLGRAASRQLHERWVSEARLLNTDLYVPAATQDPRYKRDANSKLPRKIGRRLVLFDCITCDKCIPVCPNDAIFRFVLAPVTIPIVKLRREGEGWARRTEGEILVEQKHQIASFADFCNDCGNCDVFCPEDGGPYAIKPCFFGTLEDWRRFSEVDGFHLDRSAGVERIHGRFDGREFCLERAHGRALYCGEDFELELDEADPQRPLSGSAAAEVDLTYFHILGHVRDSVYAPEALNYPNLLASR